jgi:hypothetical protein
MAGCHGVTTGRQCRGEPSCTFVIENIGLPLALAFFPQVYQFSGDVVVALIEPGLYRKGMRVDRDAQMPGQ